jgi:hypothetical protein
MRTPEEEVFTRHAKALGLQTRWQPLLDGRMPACDAWVACVVMYNAM